MIIDFLNNCRCVRDDEQLEFAELKQRLAALDPFVGFMPAIVMDLWPQYVLNCTPASKFISGKDGQIYFMPLFIHEGWGIREFCEIAGRFYADEEIECDDESTYYGAELTQMIMLDYAGGKEKLCVDGAGEANVIYARFEYEDGREFHVFQICDTADDCWRGIFDEYDIHCDMLIESHKGFGDWFTATPFYDCMVKPAKPELRPGLYFKGKYTSVYVEGFREIYSVPESRERHGTSAIFTTGWQTKGDV